MPVRFGRLLVAIFLFVSILIFTSCNEKDNPASSPAPSGKRGDGWTFRKVSGDLQNARKYDTLQQRLVVCLKDGQQNPVVWEPVTFGLSQGNGQVVAKLSPGEIEEVNTITDWNGNANVNFRFYGDTSRTDITVQVEVDSFPNLSQTFTIYPPI